VYDAANRRIRKTITNGGTTGNIPDGTTDYIYLGNQVMEERNPFGGAGSTDTPIRQYVWGTYPGAAALTGPSAQTGFRPQNTGLGGLNVDECIQLTTLTTLGPQSLPAGTYYLFQDLLYRAVALTNSSGGVVEAYDTDAYGNTLIFTAPGAIVVLRQEPKSRLSTGVANREFTDDEVQSSYGANEVIYCGYRYDPEGPGYYVRNRNYMPFLGRWIQRDPIGYQGGINLYEYVGGRAVVAVDPWGLRFCLSCAIAASSYVSAIGSLLLAQVACAAAEVPYVDIACLAALATFAGSFATFVFSAAQCIDCLKRKKCPTKADEREIRKLEHEVKQLLGDYDKLKGKIAP
jgi:RHS repeat-associated protein